MPQATLELRAQWPGGDQEAMKHLRAHGFVLQRDWTWTHPDNRLPTERENSALDYLFFEWDFGDYVRVRHP